MSHRIASLFEGSGKQYVQSNRGQNKALAAQRPRVPALSWVGFRRAGDRLARRKLQ
jgi:hypothetical protein